MTPERLADKIHTTKVLHDECDEQLGNKCQWEHMSRMAVLREWPDIVCDECRKHVRQPEALK